MKRRLGLISAFIVIIFTVTLILIQQNRMLELEVDEEGFYISLNVDNEKTEIYPWYDETEDTYYFFLPSCVTRDRVYYNHLRNHQIEIDGVKENIGGYFDWIKNEQHDIKIDKKQYKVVFMKSENIPSLFMETDSGNMEYIHADKNNEEGGTLTIISESGHMQYNGRLEKISGRGSSTWYPIKKPYCIELPEKYPLCGLNSNKEWKLLALYFEQDKIHSKIIYDLAREIGLMSPECTWVDLYCAGEYKGLYLLTEDIFEVDKEKCLIEKTVDFRVSADESSFTTENMNYIFKFTKPHYPSIEQQDKVEVLVNKVEKMLVQKDLRYVEYIDLNSIAGQFLIDEIVMETDAMRMSTFFYIDDEKISAGPIWDYDRAMGEGLPNYEASMEDEPNQMNGWYMPLYENKIFQDYMVMYYLECLPFFDEILNEKIDMYVAEIGASVEMDSIMMKRLTTPNNTNSYQEYESYIRYLKFFLANRLNYLSNMWGIEDVYFEIPKSTGEYYKVEFALENGPIIETRYVLDGECISELPEIDANIYMGWYFNGRPQCDDKAYHYLIPIYEDTVLYAKKYFELYE